MYTDLYLKFTDEAEANSVLYTEVLESYKPVEVTDTSLASHLDTLPLRDAQYDQVVDYNGKVYMADAGKWFELTDVIIGKSPKYQNIDVLGTLYEQQEIVDPENPPEPIPLTGWHVNVRVVDGEDLEALAPYSVVPTAPRRVWA
jgi:hypothetical protein